MKNILFLAVFVFGSFFIAQKLWAANTDIIINEIGAYATSTHEWIEVWNKGSSAVDLSNWKFWENNTNHSLKAVTTTDGIISPGEWAVITQDSDVFLSDYPNFIGSVLDSSWTSLNESGEEIGLKDENGNFVEKFTYVSTTKFSLERKDPWIIDYLPTNWQENVSGNTVGAQNSNYVVPVQNNSPTTSASNITSTTVISTSTSENTSTTTTQSQSSTSTSSTISSFAIFDWTAIKLNEIIPDPTDGNELIELYNNSTTSAEILMAHICDSTGTSCKPFSGNILGHDWLTVDLLTDRYLNNDGDSVVLKDENNNIIDIVSYGTDSLSAPQKGQSLIRKIDGTDTDSDSDWAITTQVTLDTTNTLVTPVVNSSGKSTSGNSGGSSYTPVSANSTTSVKTIKTNTTTIKSAVDPVKISWKLDWPYGLALGEVGIFSAAGSADPRGGDISLVWNFGDNTTGTDFIITHSYATSGVYLVSVSGASTASTTGKKDFKIYVGPEFSIADAQVKIWSYLVEATSTETEFIELKNFSTSSKNISGWKLKNKSGKEYEIPENTNIVSDGTLKFFRSITHLNFDKDGDEIRLTSPNDQGMDKIAWQKEKAVIKAIDKKENKIIKTASINSNWRSIKGVVTALPGNFGSQYFYISDGETGYQVYQYKKDFPDLKIGYRIVARGELSEIAGVSRIKISSRNSLSILDKDTEFEPINLADVSADAVGALVKISGDITSIKNNYLYIDDGDSETVIYFHSGAKINKQDFKLGDKLEVVGILEQTKSGLRVSPRDERDIKVVGFSEQVLSAQLETNKNISDDISEKYLTATAGGVTTLLLGFFARARGAIVISGAKKVVSLASKIIGRG